MIVDRVIIYQMFCSTCQGSYQAIQALKYSLLPELLTTEWIYTYWKKKLLKQITERSSCWACSVDTEQMNMIRAHHFAINYRINYIHDDARLSSYWCSTWYYWFYIFYENSVSTFTQGWSAEAGHQGSIILYIFLSAPSQACWNQASNGKFVSN